MGKKFLLLWVLGIIIGLYKAFVLMNLWNWFVAEAFHVSSISFFPMLGIAWFAQLVGNPPSRDAQFFWKKAYAMLDFCIPDEKREAATDLVKQLDGEMWEELWTGAGQEIFGATLTLVLGFCVHTLV